MPGIAARAERRQLAKLQALAAEHTVAGLAQLLAELHAAELGHNREAVEAFRRLTAVLKLDDGSAKQAAALVARGHFPACAVAITEALGAAGTATPKPSCWG